VVAVALDDVIVLFFVSLAFVEILETGDLLISTGFTGTANKGGLYLLAGGATVLPERGGCLFVV